MLHRSFKPAKCKTALKLAVSRIKLLKNKREAQVRQLKKELAKLLESGQDQTARIRVEHVVREEKTMAAYDLIEIYCELMAARLPMIESQKNCPIDLKEAVSSLIFATPRCSDLPELMDVKKQITSKYGKEFVSAAVELRPDCGVNRLLVEKLSAKAPDGPAKIKILAAIAEEHNIKWEPKSFGESDVKSSQDLLVGPNTFEKASFVEPSQVHAPPVHDERGPPSVHASSQLKPMHDASTNSYEQNTSSASRKASGNQSTISGVSDPEIRSSGPGNQEMDFRDSYAGNRSSFPVCRQNWNMEFKDAASAAQAAAESAERANMAARAAAEFSNRENMTRQYSSGSHRSSSTGSRDEVPQKYAFHDDKHLSTGSVNSTFHRGSSGIHNEQATAREQDNLVGAPNEHCSNSHQNVVKHDRSPLKSSSSFVDDKYFTYGSQLTDTYQHNNSFKQENNDLHELSSKKQASRTEEGFVTELHGDDLNPENNDHFGYARTNRQYRKASSSNLSILSDGHSDNLNLNDWTTGKSAGEDIFFTEGNPQTNTVETSSYNDTSVAFDDSGSEDDNYKFDVDQNYKGEESSLFFSSPDYKSQIDKLENTSSWRHGQNIDEKETSSDTQSHFSVVSERLTKSEVSYEKEDQLAVTFDDSDDPGSDSEVDLVKSKVSGTSNYGNYVFDQNVSHVALGSSSRTDKNLGTDRKSWLSPSSVGSDAVQEHFEKEADTTIMTENHGCDDLPTNEPSSKGRRSSILDLDSKPNIHALQSPNNVDDVEISEKSFMEDGTELNYGTLKGGRRNKSYWQPPYIKNTSDDVSSSLGDTAVQNERSLPTVRTSVSSDAPVQDKYQREVSRGNKNVGLKTHNTFSDFDRYNLVPNSQDTSRTTKPSIQKEQVEAKKKSSSRASIPYFDSDDGDSEDELPRQNSARARPVSRISRRTSASPKTASGLSSKNAPSSEAPATSGTGLGWKSSRVSNESKNQKASSTMRSSESARVQPSSSVPKTVRKDSEEGEEASKSQNSDGETPSKQKATAHVHPKLPDYDSFAAHFLSLKKDRQ